MTRIDRLARSTFDLFAIVKQIVDAKGQFRSLAEPWADTGSSAGRLMLAVLGGLADVERDLIRTRTAEGRSRAKARGKHTGRPPSSQAPTLQYDKMIFILEPSEQAKAAIGKRVTVVDYPDGCLSIRYKGIDLAYRGFDKIRPVDQGATANSKHLGAVLAMVRNEQLRHQPERRCGPRRRDQRDARLFKVG